MRLLVLTAHKAQHYGKRILPNGESKNSSTPLRWNLHEAEVSELRSFSDIAFKIEADHPNSTIVLGDLSERGAEVANRGDLIYRRHNHDQVETNHIKDRAQHLLFLDVEFEDGLDNSEISDQERVERHIQRLPSCFHDASYHAQLSSSYRIKRGLRVHLFFWAQEAITSVMLRAYIEKTLNKDQVLVDHQPITASNGITMSKPLFEGGIKDPIVQRSLFVEKDQTKVKLPSKAYKIEPKITYVSHSYRSTGPLQEDQLAIETLEEVYRNASGLGDGRNEQAYKDALNLGSLIGADRLNEAEVMDRLLHAYEVNGLIKKRSRADVERTFRRGISKGKMSPRPLENRVSSLAPRSIRPRANHQSQLPTSPQARTSDKEISKATSQLINQAFNQASPQIVSVAESMTGAGKSGALISEAIKIFKRGGSVIYLARNHNLIEGKGGLLSRFQDQGIEPDVWRGRQRRCEELKRLKTEKTQEALLRLEEYEDLLIEKPIPQFCREIQCPLFQTDQCTAWKATERPIEQRLILAPQAYLSYLVEREEKDELPEDLFIIIDERHDLIHSTPYDINLIKALSLRKEDHKYLEWFNEGKIPTPNYSSEFRALHQPISAFTLQLEEALLRITSTPQANQYGSRERLTDNLLLSIDPSLKESAEKALNYIEENDPKVRGLNLKELEQSKIKKVIAGERVKRSGLRVITDLAQLITATLDPLHTLHLFMNSKEIHVERRVIQPLPKSSKIILADATPTEEMLTDYLNILGFKMVKASSEINPYEVNGLHIQTKTLKQSALFESKDVLKDSAIKSLNNLAHPIKIMLKELGDGEQVGLICSKSLHHQIIEGREGRGALTNNRLVMELSRFHLKSGYYGKDERGSNEFEGCKALVVLGEARPNLGSAQADVETLTSKLNKGEDFDIEQRFSELYREQINSATVQAFGRLRSVWNPDLIFIHATEQTANLKGVRWSIYQAKGRGIDQKTQEAEVKAHEILDQGGLLTIDLLKLWGLTKDSAPRLIDRIVALRPLKETKISKGRGRPSSVWFDPRKKRIKSKDNDDLAFNLESQKCPPSQLHKKIAGERNIDSHEVNFKTTEKERSVLNLESQKCPPSQLINGLQEVVKEVHSYICTIGLSRINTKHSINNNFSMSLEPDQEGSLPANYSYGLIGASL